MEPYRPLRLIFFIFDFIRLAVMISLLMAFAPPAGSQGGGIFPYVFYTVPNGLFPLISFFLLFRLNVYKPYIALYMAGKILAVVAVFAWLIFSLPHIRGALLAVSRDAFTVIGTVLLLSAGDAFTILGGAVLKKRILNRGILVPEEG
ncbi:MAG: hypothetical protein LBP74_04410 [Treponema sp.]|jgi:hypothetical protein|nr:hypothetical protein [Treponema sp.]